MSDKNLLLLGIAAIIATMVLSYVLFPGLGRFVPVNENSDALNPANQRASAGDVLTTQKKEIIKETPDYSENVSYPEIVNMQDADAREKTNKAIEKFVLNHIAKFEKQILSEERAGDFQDYLQIQYLVMFLSESLVSINFSGSEDFGGAHPSSYLMTFNYDISTDREIKLSDIFKQGTDYPGIISNICREKLSAQFGDDEALKSWVEEGTKPEADSFENFGLTGNSLVVFFNPYEVGPYAMGIQTVEITFDEIKQYLNAGGALEGLI